MEITKIRKTLAANVKERRNMLKFSQEKLAEKAGLSVQSINDIEGCRRWVSDKSLTKLASALQVETYQLLVPYQKSTANQEPDSMTEAFMVLERNIQKKIKEDIFLQFEKFLKSGYI
ncbi:helix-turn-helix domain-containing protein [Leadbettera azotonutricia]|uniref:helix-turn-helix domain-containing protein n=1 Tax=Leadbettera azotonutricia TaxID=150829 RepID=UPI0006933539|nr:helix-turn-helix transcriptional regulator [Leadbettera azotonutricia]